MLHNWPSPHDLSPAKAVSENTQKVLGQRVNNEGGVAISLMTPGMHIALHSHSARRFFSLLKSLAGAIRTFGRNVRFWCKNFVATLQLQIDFYFTMFIFIEARYS